MVILILMLRLVIHMKGGHAFWDSPSILMIRVIAQLGRGLFTVLPFSASYSKRNT